MVLQWLYTDFSLIIQLVGQKIQKLSGEVICLKDFVEQLLTLWDSEHYEDIQNATSCIILLFLQPIRLLCSWDRTRPMTAQTASARFAQ